MHLLDARPLWKGYVTFQRAVADLGRVFAPWTPLHTLRNSGRTGITGAQIKVGESHFGGTRLEPFTIFSPPHLTEAYKAVARRYDAHSSTCFSVRGEPGNPYPGMILAEARDCARTTAELPSRQERG
jgi:hypothetical protein